MSKRNTTEKRIITLAYFHRYGWFVAMAVLITIWFEQMFCILSAGCFIFSIWTFVGYKNKWKHIYCSFQSAYHQKMTPNNIQCIKIKKRDAYGVPLLFFFVGLVLFVVMIWH